MDMGGEPSNEAHQKGQYTRPYPAIWAAVWLFVCDIFVPKQTMFHHRWLSVGSSQLKAWVAGLENPYITTICVARPEGLEPPTF
jgi:hypothetical protein